VHPAPRWQSSPELAKPTPESHAPKSDRPTCIGVKAYERGEVTGKRDDARGAAHGLTYGGFTSNRWSRRAAQRGDAIAPSNNLVSPGGPSLVLEPRTPTLNHGEAHRSNSKTTTVVNLQGPDGDNPLSLTAVSLFILGLGSSVLS
jgi:hypothetical protein